MHKNRYVFRQIFDLFPAMNSVCYLAKLVPQFTRSSESLEWNKGFEGLDICRNKIEVFGWTRRRVNGCIINHLIRNISLGLLCQECAQSPFFIRFSFIIKNYYSIFERNSSYITPYVWNLKLILLRIFFSLNIKIRFITRRKIFHPIKLVSDYFMKFLAKLILKISISVYYYIHFIF